jgi:hypothetical protein
MRLTFILGAMLAMTVFSSCSKDDDNVRTGECFADKITFTQTEVQTGSNNLIITFDAKNTSGKEYNIENGSKVVNLKIIVTTTDGSNYETNTVFTETKLSAGATVSTLAAATYGAGKTYASYKLTASCD